MSITEPTRAQNGADGQHVAVVGNLCLDVVIRGLSHLPQWGQEVEGVDSLQVPGGQGFNASVALATLGVRTSLVAMVGDDDRGRMIREQAAAAGVGVQTLWTHPTLPTAITAALVRADGERAFASDFGCQREWNLPTVTDQLATLGPVTHVFLAGLLNIPGFDLNELVSFLRALRDQGVQVILDTGWDALGWGPDRVAGVRCALQQVDWFLPNLDEARALTGSANAVMAARDLQSCSPGSVVIKCGSDGSIGLSGRQEVRAYVLPVEVVDAVGAGDTFDAGFLAGLLNGAGLEGAMRLGAAAAGLRLSRNNRERQWPAYEQAVAVAPQVATETPINGR